MIEVSSLAFRYRNASKPAVDDVSFTVKPGSIFGFLGPSGAGKSTVQKLLIRLLRRDGGSIRYGGVSIDELNRSFFQNVGVSFEHPNLFPKLTGRENLTCFAGLYGNRCGDPDALLEQLGLGGDKDKLAGDYSKGMKQRLVLARSLLHQPDYLFLDEPTSGLDPGILMNVLDIIEAQRARGACILLTTHDMGVADQLCDQVGFLNDGKLVANGAPRELKLAHGERAVRVERRVDGKLETRTFFIDRDEDRAALAEAVSQPGVETVHSREATLAEIFVNLTGRGLA